MTRGGRASRIVLGAVVVVAAAVRVLYVLAQPAADPSFGRPGLDGGYYLEWARALAGGGQGPPGAYYLAPLYPHFLAVFLRVVGERFEALFLLQQGATLAAAGLLAATASRLGGRWCGVATALLFLFYQPVVFFASRPVGETLAMLLLALGLFLATLPGVAPGAASGLAAGLASLSRPNLLLVVAAWVAGEGVWGTLRRAGLVAAGAALAVLPVATRNLLASGHPVLVSSNGGITLYHGNGPGALGIYDPPDGFSGVLSQQREEATYLASLRAGRILDPVEADHWWGREALRTRMESPGDTLILLGRKLLLLVDNHEHGLDGTPTLDPNPWRLTWSLRRGPGTGIGDLALHPEVSIVPFAALLGLAVAGVALCGLRRTGGWAVWGGIVACALTPLVFYMASRYRLPLAGLLAVPAGIGLTRLASRSETASALSRARALAVGIACALGSFLIPFPELRAAEASSALAHHAAGYAARGDFTAAERALRVAMVVDPDSDGALYGLAVLLERSGRVDEAAGAYREVLRRDPGHAESAGNLAGILTRAGRPSEAVPVLRTALSSRPVSQVCWSNLVVALTALGDQAGARQAAADAHSAGVVLDPELLKAAGL